MAESVYLSAYVASDVKDWVRRKSEEHGLSMGRVVELAIRAAATGRPVAWPRPVQPLTEHGETAVR